jgi:hypothetical protein
LIPERHWVSRALYPAHMLVEYRHNTPAHTMYGR